MKTIQQMTRHATLRSQQRAIPPMALDLLLQFGCIEPAGDGCTKVYLDKRARKRLDAYAGAIAHHLRDHLDIYAVVSTDQVVVTVGHRTDRVHRQ
jgi:hypothetical protein